MKKTKKKIPGVPPAENVATRTLEHEAIGAAAGAAAGVAAGVIAGPPGMIVGGIVGSAIGALSGFALERTDEEESATNERLDADLGVSGGDIGAPTLPHPEAKVGAYSPASLGLSPKDGASSSDGPIQVLDDD